MGKSSQFLKHAGFLMVVVSLLLIVVAALAMAFVMVTQTGTLGAVNILSGNRAYNLAKTAVEEGCYQLSTTGTCQSGAGSVSGQGEYQYSCTPNQTSTTLVSINATSPPSITLNNASSFAAFGAILIDSEMIFYDQKSGNNLLNVRRGVNGTLVATHSVGATVTQSQYLITGVGGAPSFSSSQGLMTLNQAVTGVYAHYYAAGASGTNGIILKYDGALWSSPTLPSLPSGLSFTGIYSSPSTVRAVGNTSARGYIYSFNGTSWAQLLNANNMVFNDVSCDAPNNPALCWTGGGATNSTKRERLYKSTTAYGGGTNNQQIKSVSCSGGTCVATSTRNGSYSFGSNATAFPATLTGSTVTLTEIHCAQANRCVGVLGTTAVYYYNGASWSSAALTSSVNGVHCPTATNCMLVGNSGKAYLCALPPTVANCQDKSIAGGPNLAAVACASITDCLAVVSGSSNTAYRYRNGAWGTTTYSTSTLNDVSPVLGDNAGILTVSRAILHNQ